MQDDGGRLVDARNHQRGRARRQRADSPSLAGSLSAGMLRLNAVFCAAHKIE
jgi:hypothetical protein